MSSSPLSSIFRALDPSAPSTVKQELKMVRGMALGAREATASTFFGHSPEVMLRHDRQATLEDPRRAMMFSGLGKLTQADVLEFPKSA